jgi:HemY protein
VNYLMAARAAEAQGSNERRDEWLALARESDSRAELAVLLTQAELQIRSRDYQSALVTLAVIEQKKPRHAGALALNAEASLALKDRGRLAEILPRLARAKLEPDRLAPLIAQGLDAMRADATFDRDALKAVWSRLPPGLRRRPALVAARARLLDRLGRGQDAVKAIASALNRRWDRDLVVAYGEVRGTDVQKQLSRAEDWLTSHGEDAALLTTTARLCMANELWGKARSYLESSLAIGPEPATFALYGELLDSLGEHDDAARAYQSGLKMVAPVVESLPALTAPVAAADAAEVSTDRA